MEEGFVARQLFHQLFRFEPVVDEREVSVGTALLVEEREDVADSRLQWRPLCDPMPKFVQKFRVNCEDFWDFAENDFHENRVNYKHFGQRFRVFLHQIPQLLAKRLFRVVEFAHNVSASVL